MRFNEAGRLAEGGEVHGIHVAFLRGLQDHWNVEEAPGRDKIVYNPSIPGGQPYWYITDRSDDQEPDGKTARRVRM